jgi:hypothetical protein
MAMARRTNPVMSVALATTIGGRVMVKDYSGLTVKRNAPMCDYMGG